MTPGQHYIIISDRFSLFGRDQGLELRDTIIIIGPRILFAFLFRVPLSEPTVAQQIIKTKTGGLNIDLTRIGTGEDKIDGGCAGTSPLHGGGIRKRAAVDKTKGRWPTNLILIHKPDCSLNNNTWSCAPDCMVKALDKQSGELGIPWGRGKSESKIKGLQNSSVRWIDNSLYRDSGGASRFYPQFGSLSEAVNWLDNLVNGPKNLPS